jgi:hypothetical protein
VTDIERLTGRIEVLERKVAKLRRALFYDLFMIGLLGWWREEVTEHNLVGAIAFGVLVFGLVAWMLKEPGRRWWDTEF